MNGAWVASSLDQLLRSPSLSLWATLAAAAFLVVVLLITLARAQKSVANIALVVVALAAIGIAVSGPFRRPAQPVRGPVMERAASPSWSSVPALACLDGLAGEAVETACEKPLFSSPESSAAAVAYTADQISRLTRASRTSADKPPPEDVVSLRRALEHDRYGLVAHVLSARDGCTAAECAFYAVIGDHSQISAHIAERTFEGLIGRYILGWNQPPVAAVAAPPPNVPTGKPLSGDFPSANSIPPVNIMTAEPGSTAATPAPKPSAAPVRPTPPPAPRRPARKPPPPPPPPQEAPVAPAAPSADN